MIIIPFGWQSGGKDMCNYSTSRGVRTWRILAQVITCDICCFSQRALHVVHSPCSFRSVVRWGGHMRGSYVCCVSSRSGIVYNPSAGVITDHSQTAKDIDSYFKFSSMWRTQATESRYSFYRMGWVNPESERTTEFNFCRGWDSNPQPFDRQSNVLPLSYDRSLLFTLICLLFYCSILL